MTTKALGWVGGTLFVSACVLIGCQVYAMRGRLGKLEDGWEAHEARKTQRETFFYRVVPVLAGVLAAVAAAGWLR
jgi:hypothetical protein